jgi:hypothetical protein
LIRLFHSSHGHVVSCLSLRNHRQAWTEQIRCKSPIHNQMDGAFRFPELQLAKQRNLLRLLLRRRGCSAAASP